MIAGTEVIILHAIDYGDSSKIVTMYSKEYGKIKVVAKGARNMKSSKFGSSLEPLAHSSIILYKKENRTLHLLSKSEIVRPLVKIHDNADKMFTGLALIELVNMVMHDEEKNIEIFELLSVALRTINEAEKNFINVFISFELKLFANFGFGMTLSVCDRCGRETETAEFDSVMLRLSDGKFVCADCARGNSPGGLQLRGGIIRSLHFLQSNDISRVCSLQISPIARDEALATLQSYLRYHIEGTRTLQSFSLLYTNNK